MTTIMVTIHWYGNKYGNQYNIDLQCIYPSLKENDHFLHAEKWCVGQYCTGSG